MNFEAFKEHHGEDAVKEAFMLGVIQGIKQAREWRPIETAPKDGTDILVYNKDRGDDDETINMMRTAFEAGRCEAGAVGLRDKFAMAALQGLCGIYTGQNWAKDIAADAYTAADAMLKERVK